MGKTSLQKSQVPSASGKVQSKEYQVRCHFKDLGIQKSMGPADAPSALRALASVIARSILIIFGGSWQ